LGSGGESPSLESRKYLRNNELGWLGGRDSNPDTVVQRQKGEKDPS
jgi:hypothetical protein